MTCVGGHTCKTNEFSREEKLTIITFLQIINLTQTIRLKNKLHEEFPQFILSIGSMSFPSSDLEHLYVVLGKKKDTIS